MRTMFAATALMLLADAGAGQALAQTVPTPPAVPGVKPKPVATTPIRPIGAPADPAAIAERTAIQSDLAWVGEYNGAINGEAGERMTAAIKTFQKNNGGKQTGVLTPQERALLAGAARKPQTEVGWTLVTDMVTGARLGLPGKLLTQQTSDANGTRWSSATGTIQIALSRRKEAAPTIAKIADQERKEPAGRRIDYSAVKPDFFVMSGMQGLKKFYVRGQVKDSEVRILTILYDQATEGTMEPVTIAMSSAFNAFPTSAQVATAPRRGVEYATGVIASADGAVITDRLAVEGCLSIVVANFGNADRIAENKESDLALLRIYGARDLKPFGFGGAAPKTALDLTGVADPQNQGGGTATSTTKVTSNGSGNLTPAPALGFSGAPARDADGVFAGMALLRTVVVAGPAPAASQAVLVPVDAVRAFLKANKVAYSDLPATDPKASVVRVICVRK